MACPVYVPQGARVLAGTLEDSVKLGTAVTGAETHEALEDGSSYGFGVSTKCLCLPYLITTLQGQLT